MKPDLKKKQIDVNQVVRYLRHAFSKAHQQAFSEIGNKNAVGDPLYDFQVEFSYLVDDIMRGPFYIVPKKIVAANQLIESLSTYTHQ